MKVHKKPAQKSAQKQTQKPAQNEAKAVNKNSFSLQTLRDLGVTDAFAKASIALSFATGTRQTTHSPIKSAQVKHQSMLDVRTTDAQTAVMSFNAQGEVSLRPKLSERAEAKVASLLESHKDDLEKTEALLSAIDNQALATAPQAVQLEALELLHFLPPEKYSQGIERALLQAPKYLADSVSLSKNAHLFFEQAFAAKNDTLLVYHHKLGQDVVQDVLFPESLAQRGKGTCSVTTMQHLLAEHQPAIYIELLQNLASAGSEGEVRDTFRLNESAYLLREDNMLTSDTSYRRVSERVFQSAAMQAGHTELEYDNKSDSHRTPFADFKKEKLKEVEREIVWAQTQKEKGTRPLHLSEEASVDSIEGYWNTYVDSLVLSKNNDAYFKELLDLEAFDGGLNMPQVATLLSALSGKEVELKQKRKWFGNPLMNALREGRSGVAALNWLEGGHALVVDSLHTDDAGQEWVHLWNPWGSWESGTSDTGPERELLGKGHIRMKADEFAKHAFTVALFKD